MQGCCVGKIENVDVAQKSAQRRLILLPAGRHFDPKQQL
jgi:hypothetical protein